MATARVADIKAAVESYLLDNWPLPSVAFIASGSDSVRPFSGSAANTSVYAQWGAFLPDDLRATEDIVRFDLRLIVEAANNDRMHADEIADELRGLTRNRVVEMLDRDDESTSVGWVRFVRVGVDDAGSDARGKGTRVVTIEGWAHA